MKNSKPAVVIFAREPILGTVKSRLSPVLDDAERLSLYKRMLRHTSAVVGSEEEICGYLYSTPDKDHPYLKALSKRFDLYQQVQIKGVLGEKMTAAFEDVLEHTHKAILIGSDCPFITGDYIESAISRLSNTTVVIGPATDGGFVMIGTTDHALMEHLFRDIEWGNSDVLETLLKNAQSSDITVELMEPLNDVDRPEDLQLLDGFTWFE